MISGLTIAARPGPCVGGHPRAVQRSFVGGPLSRPQVATRIHFKEPRREGDDARRFEKDAGKAADKAADKVEDTADRVASGAKDAADTAKGKASEAGDRAQEAIRAQTGQGKSALGYIATAALWAGLIVFKLARPEASLGAAFGNAIAAKGAELAALTGTLSSSTFLLQTFAVLAIPLATGLLVQAHASSAGRMDSDSSMRLNFGLGLHSFLISTSLTFSAFFPNLGGRALAAFSAYSFVFGTAVLGGLRESRRFKSVTEILNAAVPGFISTAARVLTPRSLQGAVYGIFCAIALAASAYTVFAQSYVASFLNINPAEATVALAHGDMVALLLRGIAANLAYLAVAFAALKELADKGGLATTTARYLNVSMTVMLAGLTLLISAGRQNGIASIRGAGVFGLASQITTFMLVGSILFSLYPSSKGRISQDTPAESY